jgi:succinate dehydrogenase / fumarate reductase cytochrome b subunit
MNAVSQIFKSTLGRKYLMAISGMVLVLFIIGHLAGNLQIFLGREAVNSYAAFLKSKPSLLWGARIGLLLMVGLHITVAVKLALENRAARPVRYEIPTAYRASYASRTMLWSGVIIAAFVIYHLLHFTAGLVLADYYQLKDSLGRHDVYGMMVRGFQLPLVSGFYVLAMALLSLHLSHGVSSLFQSLGLKDRTYGPLMDRAALIFAWLVFLGYISIPLAVLFGWIQFEG